METLFFCGLVLVAKPAAGFSWNWVYEFFTKIFWVGVIFVKIGDNCILFKSVTEFLSMLSVWLTDLDKFSIRDFLHFLSHVNNIHYSNCKNLLGDCFMKI